MRRAVDGTSVTVHVGFEGCSTDLMLSMDQLNGKRVSVELDTGSDVLILNERLAGEAVIVHGRGVREMKAQDETGHEYVRYYAAMRDPVHVSGAPSIRVTDPQVMFQKIIYDGLVGDKFLRNFTTTFTTTYDLENSRVIFAIRDTCR